MFVTMSKPQRKTDRPRRSRTYRLPEDLLDAFEQLAERTRRTVTAELEIAMEEHAKKNRVWSPPKPAD